MSKFTVEHYNFGTTRGFASYEEAAAYAVKAGFEAVIRRDDGVMAATFSPISGLREMVLGLHSY